MKTFVLGEWYEVAALNTAFGPPHYALWAKLVAEVNARLGRADIHDMEGLPPFTVTELGGVFYVKGDGVTYFLALPEWGHTDEPRPKDGVVLCPCGSKQFHVDFEHGELVIAICSQCGQRHVVFECYD